MCCGQYSRLRYQIPVQSARHAADISSDMLFLDKFKVQV